LQFEAPVLSDWEWAGDSEGWDNLSLVARQSVTLARIECSLM
jgi:hypothetical protein